MQNQSEAFLKNPATALAVTLLKKLRHHLQDPGFRRRHRRHDRAFTRKRVLTFSVVVIFILQKTAKSLQLHLHEFLGQGSDSWDTAGAGAVTRARAKLSHSAYVALNSEILLPAFYSETEIPGLRLWRGHRVLGVDSSLVRLPSAAELFTRFGRVECANKKGKSSVAYPPARISVLYDVLNHIGWDARLEPHTLGETDMARQHPSHARPGDLILCDRGYAGFYWFILMRSMKVDFVVRCSQGSFAAVQELFKRQEAGISVEVILSASSEIKPQLRREGLPLKLRVRLVAVRLSTGELEVLATSLLELKDYPTGEFAQVYHWRWGIETYYSRLKSRLDLEHWSGQTEESIRQDFHATVFLSNLESVLSRTAQQELAQETSHRETPAQLNRAVCLHTIKNNIIHLLASRRPVEKVLIQLQRLFKANPGTERKKRKVPRRETPPGQAYQYQRNVKKLVF
jgi:hypothetical protein